MDDQTIRRRYRMLDWELARFYYRIQGPLMEQPRLFIPNGSSLMQERKILIGLRQDVNRLPVPSLLYHPLHRHFLDFLDFLDYRLNCLEENPQEKYTGFHASYESFCRLSRQPAEKRFEYLKQVLEQYIANADAETDAILKSHGQESVRRKDAAALAKAAAAVKRDSVQTVDMLKGFNPLMCRQISTMLDAFSHVLENMAAQLCPDAEQGQMKLKTEDDLNRTIQMSSSAYRQLLSLQYGVSLDSILVFHNAEITRTREEVLSIASSLPISEKPKTMQEVSALLMKYEPPCRNAEEMFRKEEEYLQRTRMLAHEVVDLPDDESCVCVPVPEDLKDSFPWGGYEGGDMDVLPFHGQMFLNQYNVANITDGWIKLNALHEAYPGHHVQYVRAAMDTRPQTVKIGAKVEPLLEGTCLRTEKAFGWIFGEDPFFPLFTAYRRHHASVRILVDLMLYYYGAPLKDAVALYQKELGFDFVTARAQVQAQQDMPGYFTSYYYGMKQLESWEKEYGFSKKDYTELLMSAGFISLDSFHEIMKLNKEDRYHLFHDFGSIMQK